MMNISKSCGNSDLKTSKRRHIFSNRIF